MAKSKYKLDKQENFSKSGDKFNGSMTAVQNPTQLTVFETSKV